MGVPSLNDLAVDGTLNTNKQTNKQKQNENLKEEIVDLQGRSMRDNLLFFGFEECRTSEDRANEQCINKILQFCEAQLGIQNAKEKVKIDRAHRIGRFTNDSRRPIVVKCNFHQDKLLVKKQAYEKLKETSFRVSDQYPRTVQERRKALIPHLIKAKQDGKRAVFNYDKFFINGQLFKENSSHLTASQ